MYVWLWVYGMIWVVVGHELCWVQQRTMARPVNLAQASQSRLSKMNGSSPGTFAWKVAQATSSTFWASEHLAQARGVSPKRDPACAPAPFLSPRLGGEGLAWAGVSRLSETLQPWARGWARQCAVWMFGCSWMVSIGLEMNGIMRNMYIMGCYVCLAWFVNYVWRVGYDLGMWNEWVVWN